MSVWGRINRDEVAHEQDDASSEDAQCTICYNGSQSVRFKPCNHAACKNCVDDLRRANIFKADAGVKCPYCRTYVENYEPVERGSALNDELAAANKAAKAAASARHGPQMPSIQTVTAPPGISQSATQERWRCSCGKANTGFRERCGSCSRPNPIAPASKETERKDLMKCTPDEILALAIQKLHPSLDSAFREAGMPVEQSSASSGNNLTVTGTDKTVQAAIQKQGLEKLKRIVKSLTRNGHVHTLLFHWFGNYTLQDLVVASSQLRTAATAALVKAQETGQGQMQMSVLHDVIDGKSDLLGALVMEVTKDAVEAALHKQGTYALQKVLESPCRDSEFVQLGQSLMEQALQLVSGEPGIYVMAKLVDQLHKAAKKLPQTTDSRAAQVLLDKLCALYFDKKAKYMDTQRFEKLRFDMLVLAIDGALPEHSSAMLALMLAQSAFEIQKKPPGRFLVKQLLKLQATQASSVQVMQNVVCHVGESFEQNLVELMLKPDDRPPHVVTVLMQELSTNEETEWVEHLVGEMVDGAAHFRHSPDAMHILKESLALPCLREDFLEEQLALLEDKVPNRSEFDKSVWKMRKKKLEKKQAALANGAAATSSQEAADSPTAGQSDAQAPPPTAMPSVAPEANMSQAPVPASQMLSLQQVEAQQAAQQLLQGQQQPSPAVDHSTPGSVQSGSVSGAGASEAADAGEPSQVKAQSYQPDDVKKVHYPGSLPSYIPPDEQQKLIKQARLHSADAASVPQAGKSPPPGFASTNGFAGPSEARAGQVAPSPDRGRQTSGTPQYNPVSGSPTQPSQAKSTPSQSPERATDPLAFILNPLVAQGQPSQRTAPAAAGRKTVRAAYQPYQPPSDGAQRPPPQQQPKAQKPARSPSEMSPRASQGRPFAPYMPPADAPSGSTAAWPEAVIANVIPPLAVQPPPHLQRKVPEQAYYKPPADRNPVLPARGSDSSSITHASQQPLPRSNSNDIWGPEASLAAANVPARGQVPFVQQQQNKQQPLATHAQKPNVRAPPQQAQQRLSVGQGRGQVGTSWEGMSPRPDQAEAAPAFEAAPAGWTCPTCTYRHEGKQAGFLACAMCGGVRKSI